MKAIVTCKCNDTPRYAVDAYTIMFDNEEIPKVYSGKAEIHILRNKLEYDSEIYRYLTAMAMNRDRFAYLVEYEDGAVLNIVDLLNKRRLA